MGSNPRQPLDYETPKPTARRHSLEAVVSTYCKGVAAGSAVTMLGLSVAAGAVSDIAIGFAVVTMGAAIMVTLVSGVVLLGSLALAWWFAGNIVGLRPLSAAAWAGVAQGVVTVSVMAGLAWRKVPGSDMTDVLWAGGGTVLLISGYAGWWLFTREPRQG